MNLQAAIATFLLLVSDGSIVEFQQTRTVAQTGGATLVDLHPGSNAWFLLTQDGTTYHLENPLPHQQRVALREDGLHLAVGTDEQRCDPVRDGALAAARRQSDAFVPVCGGRLYLRNRVRGHGTSLERATDFLRDHVWGGDAIVGFVRREFFADKYLDTGTAPRDGGPAREAARAPREAAILRSRAIAPATLAIDVGRQAMQPGRWYDAAGVAGVQVSFASPDMLTTDALDEVEAKALVYLVAFDLDAFDLHFTLGTDHPRVGWSDRPPDALRGGLAGPDGFDTIGPLATTGMVPPWLASRTVASFTGGFKRQHGAFKYGPFATRNRGSHYGFAEQGVVFSTLQPGLATLYVLDDGTVGMKSWTRDDDALLPRLRDARQNGVPLVETDEAGRIVPGALVKQWGPGNWSGSADEKLRTLRAGACLQRNGNARFLIYGWFSTATPAGMAQVFQAYGCSYAMHLDMNALEHTYLALYRVRPGKFDVEHLVAGMEQLDLKNVPRFIGMPDDRDFFYLTRRR